MAIRFSWLAFLVFGTSACSVLYGTPELYEHPLVAEPSDETTEVYILRGPAAMWRDYAVGGWSMVPVFVEESPLVQLKPASFARFHLASGKYFFRTGDFDVLSKPQVIRLPPGETLYLLVTEDKREDSGVGFPVLASLEPDVAAPLLEEYDQITRVTSPPEPEVCRHEVPEGKALLEERSKFGAHWGIGVRSLDGERVNGSEFALSPGGHEVEVSVHSSGNPPRFMAMDLHAEPDRHYLLRIGGAGPGFGTYVLVWIEDCRTGQHVSSLEFSPY